MSDSVQSEVGGSVWPHAELGRGLSRRAGISPSSDEIWEGIFLIQITHRRGQVLCFKIQ